MQQLKDLKLQYYLMAKVNLGGLCGINDQLTLMVHQ